MYCSGNPYPTSLYMYCYWSCILTDFASEDYNKMKKSNVSLLNSTQTRYAAIRSWPPYSQLINLCLIHKRLSFRVVLDTTWFWDKYLINPLWPPDAIWWHRYGSTLFQVMACSLSTIPKPMFKGLKNLRHKSCSHITILKLLLHLPGAKKLTAVSNYSITGCQMDQLCVPWCGRVMNWTMLDDIDMGAYTTGTLLFMTKIYIFRSFVDFAYKSNTK